MRFSNLVPFVVSSVMLMTFGGCAGSKPAEEDNSDEIRARAASAYSEIDFDDDNSNMPSVRSSKKSAPKSSKKPSATVTKLSGSMLKQLSEFSCPNEDDLRGMGMGQTTAIALTEARSDIAGQIQASLEGMTVNATKQSMDADGDETIKRQFASETKQLVKLKNANDAKSVAVVEGDGNYGVLACMSRADAAKPFVGNYELLKDSLIFAVEYFEKNQHPKNKGNIYKRTIGTFGRYLAVENILTSLDYPVGSEARDAFGELQQMYMNFKKNYAFYFSVEDGDDDSGMFSSVLFERISKDYNVSDEECTGGLRLIAKLTPVSCKDGSWGLNCSLNIVLAGSSCQGETYFKVNSKVSGSDVHYDESKAKERIIKAIAEDNWFNDWKKELDKWKLD